MMINADELHILNVNTTIDLMTGGGTAERTFQMSRFLALKGSKCTVLTIDTGLDLSRVITLRPAIAVIFPLIWRRYYIPLISWKTISKLVADTDIVHLMGHWSLLNALIYFVLRGTNKPYVVCPAGALPLFGRSKWFKRLYNIIVGKNIILNASGWIAVTSAEFPHFESYGIDPSQVTVIPNGISKADFPPVDINSFRQSKGLPDKPIILFMGRLNPIKGPDLLLQAFIMVRDNIPDFQLVFAGPDEGMQSALIDMAKQEGIIDRVHFLGFVSGDNKSAAYHMASLLVVPSRQEAMSIVALEAGICGTPVLLTDQCGFGEIKDIDSRLEVPANSKDIASGLVQLLSNSEELKKVSFAFEKFVLERYSWDFIVDVYLDLYGSLLGIPERE
jgi:glycosyltransferase involved in cell wall biosynthesis